MTGWLAGSRVRHIRTGATGTVVAQYSDRDDPDPPYSHPIVEWDDGTRVRINGDALVRAADDWLSRAVEGTP